jgi:antitoxin YefM
MRTIPISNVRTKLFQIVDDATVTHEPLLIKGKRNNAVIISEDDWNAIQETLYILSVPGMREAITDSSNTPISEYCYEKDLPW